MTAITLESSRPKILDEISASQRRTRRIWRLQFSATWLVLIGALLFALWVTHNLDFTWIGTWSPFILGGTASTVLICVASIILATGLAIVGAVARLSGNPFINGVASLYVSLVRGTPLLAQILFVYLALPQMGVTLDPLLGGILALGFNYGAYMTEVFRAGIQAVPRGQREAAMALGMPERLLFRRVILPQAFRIVIPAIGNDFVAMIKDSSLLSVVAVQELLWRAQRAGTTTFHTLQAIIVAAAVYWLLTIIFSFFQERLERRMARGDR